MLKIHKFCCRIEKFKKIFELLEFCFWFKTVCLIRIDMKLLLLPSNCRFFNFFQISWNKKMWKDEKLSRFETFGKQKAAKFLTKTSWNVTKLMNNWICWIFPHFTKFCDVIYNLIPSINSFSVVLKFGYVIHRPPPIFIHFQWFKSSMTSFTNLRPPQVQQLLNVPSSHNSKKKFISVLYHAVTAVKALIKERSKGWQYFLSH